MRINQSRVWFFILIIGLIIWAGSRCGPSSYSREPKVKLYFSSRGETITLTLEQYLIGVVAAEMPVSFGNEALKAQAVTARTYTLKRLYAKPKHPHGAQMCDDIRCCQAYIAPQDYKIKYGKELYDRRFIPVMKAVRATRGQVLEYQGNLIDTPYFSTCGGKTASSLEVWGQDIPYLKSVKCPFCTQSKRYNNQIEVSLSRVNQVLNRPRNQKFKFQKEAVTTSGRLRIASVDGREISGQDLRRMFDLPSTQILNARQVGKQVIFECRGYGHGVGLCQYGAGGMAQKGYNYQHILRYYYQGVSLVKLNY